MKIIFFIIFLILLIGCKDKYKFDKKAWAEHTELMKYPNRNDMTDDLIKNYQLKGKKYNEIIDLLGEPFPAFDFRTDTTMLYPIDISFDKEHSLNHTKALFLRINKDSIVRSFDVAEWGK